MTTGNNTMPPHAPTPDEAEGLASIIEYFIIGLTAILGAVLTIFKGRKVKKEQITVAEVEHRILISSQATLLTLNNNLDERDRELFKHIDRKNDDLLKHVKDIIDAGK